MPRYRVFVQQVVSHYIDVDAEDTYDAGEKALEEGLPVLMFTDYRYPDESEWEISEYEGTEQIEELV